MVLLFHSLNCYYSWRILLYPDSPAVNSQNPSVPSHLSVRNIPLGEQYISVFSVLSRDPETSLRTEPVTYHITTGADVDNILKATDEYCSVEIIIQASISWTQTGGNIIITRYPLKLFVIFKSKPYLNSIHRNF